MESAETKLKSLAVSLGADLVGVTTRDLLADQFASRYTEFLK